MIFFFETVSGHELVILIPGYHGRTKTNKLRVSNQGVRFGIWAPLNSNGTILIFSPFNIAGVDI